jgi:putative membrane-bound dehydrogenase-like protein
MTGVICTFPLTNQSIFMRFFLFYLAALLFSALILGSSCQKSSPPDEHDATRSLADLEVFEGLEVSLFASEPMFSNPTNMAIDERGRVWICEAYNYRNQYNPKNPLKAEGDRIVILEDTDGDGQADHSKVFYQGTDINSALGITLLGNKVIVSCSPNVFVFTDENGDDIPEKKEIMFQGIQGVQHDHGMHAFVFGPDGRLYFNFGNEGKSLVTAAGDTVTDIHGLRITANGKPLREGMVFRAAMDGSQVEVLGNNFRNNYEVAVDPYGTMWQSDNDDDGNKGTRINYVMEYGNYGYRDELSGASWSARRTNMEKEIPLRHWHLNDPGVVPNVLQTGAGSPSGITVYEGHLLPEVFYGQLIHAEPGNNVVRSYQIEDDGAGYKASIIPILQSREDQWFRPIDVAVAPDGSLFVADWYDPGVGGHQAGDVDRGRIYRIAPARHPYRFDAVDVNTLEGAVAALQNPNASARYLGWMALEKAGKSAENELKSLWSAENPRVRAQALWLLTKLADSGPSYLTAALQDDDPNIRITAIRIVRAGGGDVLTVAGSLVQDASLQVRREMGLALHGNSSPAAAAAWTSLALQYDGKDRWYLEALGIGAAGNWDSFFAQWQSKIGKDWNTPANRDIIWRSRTEKAIPLLSSLIRSSDDRDMLRYFRAFDFHQGRAKQQVLTQLALSSSGDKVLYALKHLDPKQTAITPALRSVLDKVLKDYEGKIEFVELATSFGLKNKAQDLLNLAIKYPDSLQARESVRTLLAWDRSDMITAVIESSPGSDAQAIMKGLKSHMYNPVAIGLMENVMMDSTKDMELRKLAVKSFGGPWQAEDRLLVLAKEEQIPASLHTTAAGVFQGAWRAKLREEAAGYLDIPGSKEGKPLPTIADLSSRTGDAVNGKLVFGVLCSNCHVVSGEGVNFGPELSQIGAKLSREGLYSAILYPDQGISFGFEGFRFQLADGSVAVGRITSETPDAIELQYMSSMQTIPSAEVTARVKLETSLMPGSMQSSMSEQELVDLVEYLGSLRKADQISAVHP